MTMEINFILSCRVSGVYHSFGESTISNLSLLSRMVSKCEVRIRI